MTHLVKQIFTFGFGQQFEGGYHIVFAETKDECRKKMFKRFGRKWSAQYNTKEEAGVKKYNLREIK